MTDWRMPHRTPVAGGMTSILAVLIAALVATTALAKLDVTKEMCVPPNLAAQVWNAFDGSIESHVDDPGCKDQGVGVDFAQPKKVAYIRVYPSLGQAARLQSGRFEASRDGQNWDVLFDMTQWAPFQERRWVTIALAKPAEYRFYRMTQVEDGRVAELEFYDTSVPETTTDATPVLPPLFAEGKLLETAGTAITILPPSYRGMVSTARRESAVRFGYLLNPGKGGVAGLSIDATVKNAAGKTIASATVKTGGEMPAFFSVPVPADAPAGDYALEAGVKTPNGREKAVVPFKILPVRPKQFFIDQDGTILKEGKPFFPLGLHHAHAFQIDEWLPMGVNMVQMWAWDWNDNCSTNEFLWYNKPTNDVQRATMMAQKRDCLRKMETNDIYIIYEESSVWNELIEQSYGKFGPADKWTTTPYPFETNVATRARVQAAIADPLSRVGMWYIADEVGGAAWVPKLQRASKYFHDMDENHPTFNLSAGDHDCAPGGDVYAFDCYPRYYGGTQSVTRISDTTASAYSRVGSFQPIIVVPQAFGESPKQPTEKPEHVRAMSYLAIVRGAKGMFWYCWKQTGDWTGAARQGMGWNPPTAEVVKKVIAEFKVFDNALLVPGTVHLTSADGLVLGILAGDDTTGRFLVYVNGDLAKTSDSTIDVPLPAGAKLEPLFGGPEAKISKGKLTLKLGPLATGAFQIKGK